MRASCAGMPVATQGWRMIWRTVMRLAGSGVSMRPIRSAQSADTCASSTAFERTIVVVLPAGFALFLHARQLHQVNG